jgi:hypothetical protein
MKQAEDNLTIDMFEGNEMKKFVVLYRIEKVMSPLDAPFGFVCDAEDADHAEEQCTNAYPDCDVVWVVTGESYQDALGVYWNTEGKS